MNDDYRQATAGPDADAPPGFTLLPSSTFVKTCGGLYIDPSRDLLAARIRPEHLNPLEIAHGGFLATLADTAFGWVLKQAAGDQQPPATVSLALDYLSPARPGDWVEAHVQIHKLGRLLSHASLQLRVGKKLLVQAKATFVHNSASLHGAS